MLSIRSRHLEQDLHSSGFVEAFGDMATAVRSVRFEDRRIGIYQSSGGLIGKGSVLVDRYRTTAAAFDMLETDFINFERVLEGAALLAGGGAEPAS